MRSEMSDIFVEEQIPTNPFPGLRPFDFEESHLFFGRDGQSEQLITKLGATRFLAVVGTSGSGKSSLVRAGLMPSLLGGFMTSAGSNWRIAVMRPGSDPIGNLARVLNGPDVFGSDVTENAELQTVLAEATLHRGSRGLVDAVRQAVIGENENLLVIVDQFEEIFRFARVSEEKEYRDEAAAFVKLLLEAVRQREVPIYVVLTMRSDYLGDCSQFWGLPEAINESQYLIPRLTRDQLKEAITGPISVGQGQITPRLVARLLNDVGDDQDQLPVLQHLLMRVWDECKDKQLSVEISQNGKSTTKPHRSVHAGAALDLCCYDAVGGMSEALSRHADEALGELPGASAQLTAGNAQSLMVAEKLFKALTEKGPDNREIRRPATLGEICATSEARADEVITVIETFRRPGRSFLMPPPGVPLTSDALIDISHESLIRGWSRLKEWVEEESRSARIYRRVAETAVLEKEGGAGLWRDPDLQIALTWRQKEKPNKVWAQRYHREFDLAMSFVDRSVEERDREIKEKENQRRKSIRRTRWTAMVLGILCVFSLVALVVAVRQTAKANSAFAQLRDSSEHAKQDAIEREKDKIAKANLEKERQAADNFAAEAKRLRDIAEEEKQKAIAQAAKVARLEQQARKEANEANEINDLTHQLNEALRTAKAEEVVAHGSELAGRYRNKTKPDALGEYETQTILGSAYLELNRNSDAQGAARRALEIQGSAAINNNRNRHENLSVLRDAYLKESDKAQSKQTKDKYLAQAFENGVDALTLLRAGDKVTNASDPALISDLSSLVLISEKLAEFQNSEKYGEQIVQVQQNIVTAALEDLTRYLDDQADFNKAHGNYEKAEFYLKKIILMQEKLLDPNDSKLVATLSELADVYRVEKKDSAADQVVQRIQRIEGKEALLRRGSSGPEVTSLQQLLKARGFYADNADGYFGLTTEVAVTNFQGSVGLQADGIVGPATLQRLAKPQAATPGTRDVQAALKQLGFYPLSVDGSFGMATKAALMSFQRSKGLNADGNVNAETLAALGLTPVTVSVTGKITVDLVSKMFPNIPVENIKANLPDILHALEDAGLTDKEMAVMAIATVGIETGGTFEPTEERKSRFNTSADGYAFDLYDNRLDLGNEGPPDGERFKGRGYIQLTGRANYKRFGAEIGVGDELIKNPELAVNASVAAKIFVQYLKGVEKQIRVALVAGDFVRATRNAGLGNAQADEFAKAYQTGLSLIP